MKATHRYAMFALMLWAISLSGVDRSLAEDEPGEGSLRKQIPQRLIVLTFDDGCVSHAKEVAPLLKEYSFGATFYVCGPKAFSSQEGWDRANYLSGDDLVSLKKDGFEIGNHTLDHAAGNMKNFTDLEDYLANCKVPKPTTMCWPAYAVRPKLVPELIEAGYVFGRGGHERVYRPEVDCPMDVPSFTIKQDVGMKGFVAAVRQATEGRVVVLTFHGIPDVEHPWVTVEPELFKEMMAYLKRNEYQVIAMRDMKSYLDMDVAMQLPMTEKNVKDAGPEKLLEDRLE